MDRWTISLNEDPLTPSRTRRREGTGQEGDKEREREYKKSGNRVKEREREERGADREINTLQNWQRTSKGNNPDKMFDRSVSEASG